MAREALKKIVVFGGNGFVGSEVLQRLSAVPTVHAGRTTPVTVTRLTDG